MYTNRRKKNKKRKVWYKKQVWDKKNETEDQSQPNPYIDRDLNNAMMHFWSKFRNPDFNRWWLMARTNSQAQHGVNFDFEVKFDFEVRGQLPLKTICISTKLFYTFGPNLAILAWTSPELAGQASDWHTDWHTHTDTHTHTHRRRRWQYPKAKTGLR